MFPFCLFFFFFPDRLVLAGQSGMTHILCPSLADAENISKSLRSS